MFFLGFQSGVCALYLGLFSRRETKVPHINHLNDLKPILTDKLCDILFVSKTK